MVFRKNIEMVRCYISKIYRKIRSLLGLNLEENVFKTTYEKRALLCYLIDPFTNAELSDIHQNVWQMREIARIINKFGYVVDVINYNEKYVKLRYNYDLIIDICPTNQSIYLNHMNKECIKIVYFTGSNSSFANNAEMNRIEDLRMRRGITVKPRRQAALTPKFIEDWDAVFFIGNAYNLETYRIEFDLPPTFMIPNTGYDFKNRFNLDKLFVCKIKKKNCFLYFGSAGCVHKGLDIILDVFSQNDFPCELYVCGPFKDEKDFERIYINELYNSYNIHSVGWVDIWSDKFREIASKCTYGLLPSCSEAHAGAVLTMMSAGIIPICSRECGFEDDEVINLPDCYIDTLKKFVIEYSKKDPKWIEEKAKNVMKIANEKYSKNQFTIVFEESLRKVLNDNNENNNS